MTKFIAFFTGLIFCFTLSACSTDKSGIVSSETISPPETSNSEAISTNSKGTSTQTPNADKSAQVKPSTITAPKPSQSNNKDEISEAVVNQNAITITPQKDSKHFKITYPQYEINKDNKHAANTSYTLLLTSGDYSDHKNAITTFLFDLYMKQSVCFDNAHSYIDSDKKYQSFLRTIFFLEAMNLNLGQIDVLVLPRLEYYEDNVPYLFRNTPAFKTLQDDTIKFGSTVESDKDYKQVSRGSFDCTNAILFYEVSTVAEDATKHTTYFEAVKTKAGDFNYRYINIHDDIITSVFVVVYNDYMQAGYSEGKIPKDFKFKPLEKTTTMQTSDMENGLKQIYDLSASGDGVMITPVKEQE